MKDLCGERGKASSCETITRLWLGFGLGWLYWENGVSIMTCFALVRVIMVVAGFHSETDGPYLLVFMLVRTLLPRWLGWFLWPTEHHGGDKVWLLRWKAFLLLPLSLGPLILGESRCREDTGAVRWRNLHGEEVRFHTNYQSSLSALQVSHFGRIISIHPNRAFRRLNLNSCSWNPAYNFMRDSNQYH